MKNIYILTLLPFIYANAQITPPSQPTSGPGGSNYTYLGVDSNLYGTDLTNMFWLFEPNNPKPDSAPVVTVWHGMTTISDSTKVANMHLDLIKHIVKKGYSVVYPLYQYGSRELTPYSYQRTVCAAIMDSALKLLDSGSHVKPKRDGNGEIMLATTGYSKGGSMSITMASSYWNYNLPQFKAVASFVSFDANAETDSIPSDTKILVALGEDDENIEDFVTVDTLLNRYYRLTHIPCENKTLLLFHSDSTGSPPLTADHHFYVANSQSGSVDALDYYGSWKLCVSLFNCAFYNTDCDYVLGTDNKVSYLGKWSNGADVNPITILDSCDITSLMNMKQNDNVSVWYDLNSNEIEIQISNTELDVRLDILLFDLSGKLVLNKHLESEKINKIYAKFLNEEIYIYLVRSDGNIIKSGKLSKQE